MILIILGISGGLGAGILGWIESGEAFDSRKFSGTLIRSAITGLVGVLAFQNIPQPTIWEYAMAFITGMGIDYGGNTIGKLLG